MAEKKSSLVQILEPRMDVLIVQRDEEIGSVRGIYLPGNSTLGRSSTGVVRKAGPVAKKEEGRRIVFGINAGIQPKIQGTSEPEIVLLRPTDILAYIDGPGSSGGEGEAT